MTIVTLTGISGEANTTDTTRHVIQTSCSTKEAIKAALRERLVAEGMISPRRESLVSSFLPFFKELRKNTFLVGGMTKLQFFEFEASVAE